jgi:uracil-DNA glycosylase
MIIGDPTLDKLVNPSVVKVNGYIDNEMGPWTKWYGHHNADILVVGESWGSYNVFKKQMGKDELDKKGGANSRLIELFKFIGINLKRSENQQQTIGNEYYERLFFTNALLCLPCDDNNVKDQWFINCGKKFLKALIDKMYPTIVIALGSWSYFTIKSSYIGDIGFNLRLNQILSDVNYENSLREKYQLKTVTELRKMIYYPRPIPLNDKTVLFVVPHPSGSNAEYNDRKKREEIWNKIKIYRNSKKE